MDYLRSRACIRDYFGTREECAHEAARAVLGSPELSASVNFARITAWVPLLGNTYLGERPDKWYMASKGVDTDDD